MLQTHISGPGVPITFGIVGIKTAIQIGLASETDVRS